MRRDWKEELILRFLQLPVGDRYVVVMVSSVLVLLGAFLVPANSPARTTRPEHYHLIVSAWNEPCFVPSAGASWMPAPSTW